MSDAGGRSGIGALGVHSYVHFPRLPRRLKHHPYIKLPPRDAAQRSPEKKLEPVRNLAKKVGRNDPCPCGSGKKFKACCMRKQSPASPR